MNYRNFLFIPIAMFNIIITVLYGMKYIYLTLLETSVNICK